MKPTIKSSVRVFGVDPLTREYVLIDGSGEMWIDYNPSSAEYWYIMVESNGPRFIRFPTPDEMRDMVQALAAGESVTVMRRHGLPGPRLDMVRQPERERLAVWADAMMERGLF